MYLFIYFIWLMSYSPFSYSLNSILLKVKENYFALIYRYLYGVFLLTVQYCISNNLLILL